MAKAKKGRLTIEDALVPVEERPYEIPANWCWTKLAPIVNIQTGKKDANYGCEDGEYYFFTCASEPIRCADYSYDCKAVLLAGNGDISNISIYEGKFEAYQRTYIVETKKDILTEYLYYYFKYRWVDYNIDKMFGTAIPYIRLGNLNDFEIPIPPLEEQKRIVEQIEKLFSKLDEAKNILLDVQQSYKLQKQSLLQEAFSGNLTKEWRLQNEVSFEQSWADKCLDEVCASIYDGDHMPPPKSDSGVHFLVISNVNTGHLSFEDTRFVPEEYYKKLTDTRKPQVGDVLYTLVGSYGIPVIVDDERPFCFQRHMGLLKPRDVDTNFLWYQLQTQEFFDKATSIANGTAQLTVPIKGLRKLTIKCPSSEEQLEIVRILDDLMNKQALIKDTVDGVLNKIEEMRKSILAKAFRGELGTNNLEDESAIELLTKLLE